MTLHSFSFGPHYDPENLAFGPMRAFDDHSLAAGAGFDEHRHSAIELVTWVQSGTLVHTEPDGTQTHLPAGSVQVQSAGTGILHTEHASHDCDTRFIQSWLVPDDPDALPSRTWAAIAPSSDPSSPLRPVAGAGTDLPVHSCGAVLWQGTLLPGSSTPMPSGFLLLLFVLSGEVEVSSTRTQPETLVDGDALRASAADGSLHLTAESSEGASVLVWTFDDAARG